MDFGDPSLQSLLWGLLFICSEIVGLSKLKSNGLIQFALNIIKLMKASGVGRDGGDYSFDFYMETKNVCIATNDHSVPKLGKN